MKSTLTDRLYVYCIADILHSLGILDLKQRNHMFDEYNNSSSTRRPPK